MPRMRWRLGELTTLPQTPSQLGGGHPQGLGPPQYFFLEPPLVADSAGLSSFV